MELDLSNVVSVLTSETDSGIESGNLSNLALFTREDALSGFGTKGFKTYKEPSSVATDFGSDSVTAQMAISIFSQQPNILQADGSLVVITQTDNSETLAGAIVRTSTLTDYFGIIATHIVAEGEGIETAAIVQNMNKMLLFVSRMDADIEDGDFFDDIRDKSQDKTRCLFHKVETDLEALQFLGAYASRAFSVDFTLADSTGTMNLKTLIGIKAGNFTQALADQATSVGADIYANIGGSNRTLTSGENGYFDSVYNRLWFYKELQVKGFNTLATLPTKIPQTELGQDTLNAAYKEVCIQAVLNGYVAAGKWTDPETFGLQSNFLNNITDVGYFVYSEPITNQRIADRIDRKAPVTRIAIKEAGAIHSSNVIIRINA